MLIEKFMVPASDLAEVGLQPIEMNRLGRFVALAGKNGAGKTRVLDKLNAYILLRNQHVGQTESLRQNILAYQNAINGHSPGDPNQEAWKRELANQQNNLAILTERISPTTAPVFGVLRFVPKQLNLADPRQNHKAALQSNFDQARNPGLESFEHRCFSCIQMRQNREWEVTHQRSTHDLVVIQSAKEE